MIKKDLEAAKRSKQEKPNESEPEFRFEGNKKQYKLNRNVLDKIGSAMATTRKGTTCSKKVRLYL